MCIYTAPAPRSRFLPFGFDAGSYSIPDDLALKLSIRAIDVKDQTPHTGCGIKFIYWLSDFLSRGYIKFSNAAFARIKFPPLQF